MMLRYTDRAKFEVEAAFAWYEKQRGGLGYEFLTCLEVSLQNIIVFPEMYQIRYAGFRGCPIRRFPFSIYYTVEENGIVIHAVFDNRQDPDKRP